ncbi:GNAT family N-acetyltransferase [Paractinoplanes abujensis]|uniref:Ribosomal protein S18 acetylase RimI-like enzyme n=1 Tax=Paractinoplanes abujensis TaxID=882441 RepID=A0A7W7G6L7_9ACTN|nr:GNAT family N-acetyltransferase [Actinoplanes abujensis]MBB4697704.1 ribosomal protein S18 acetylase RimI-like enzyme [Actinoplanes abujensis]
MTVVLVDLTSAELAQRWPSMIALFADAMVENYGVSPAEAAAEAERQTDELLPAGVHTAGQLLRKGMDGDDEVGFLWISLPGTTYDTMAWIAEVSVRADRRSRGYGSAMLRAGEADLVERGVRRVGLHVFGVNTGARRLYRRLGYQVLAQLRTRPVGAPQTTVELEPMSEPEYAARLSEVVERHPVALTRDPLAPAARAREVARVLAPQGVDSPNVFLRHAVSGGRPVGWIWFSLPGPHRPGTGAIHYLTIDEPYRRRGLGRALLAAAEAEYARHDVGRLGLWIAGPDAGRFADALGLEVSSEQLVKDL